MLQKYYQTFGLMLTLPLLLANNETANLSDLTVETVPSPTPEIQPVIENSSEQIIPEVEPQLTQPPIQNRREGREYCQGIGVC
ncbi:MAG: hypothetical protein WBA13_23085 [Microcoleaceae cyanobacterium]